MSIWSICQERLRDDIPQNLFNMWILPLQAEESAQGLLLLAPNVHFVRHIRDKFLPQIESLCKELSGGQLNKVTLQVGSRQEQSDHKKQVAAKTKQDNVITPVKESIPALPNNINPLFTFESYVQGKSNQLALAGALQVASNLGSTSSNPLFIYGPTGLGKTHLMHAVGNAILKSNPNARVLYITSEQFVSNYVSALQHKLINDFKRAYRMLDLLLIDDIHFFAGKLGSQEEFFHTFNTLLEGSRQIILTSDRFHKEINELDDRLQSRFAWGLTIKVDPPNLETRVAILNKKAEQNGFVLSHQSAFFIAQHVQANVRELEGALNNVMAMAKFKGCEIDVDLVKDSLKDVLALRAKQINIDNIQRVVADYYNIPLKELKGKKRHRSFARPRQVAMALSRELTSHSYPEIGMAFEGRDHSTVMHACERVEEMKKSEPSMAEDYTHLMRLLQA